MTLAEVRRLGSTNLQLLCLLSSLATAAVADATRPNIVVLLADDLGYGELGCQGNKDIPTPHIDSIAANGIRFTDGYVSASFCSASRAGLLTGRYQTRFGYEFNPIGAENADPLVGLPADELTLAQHLHDTGYATCLVGKWHLGGTAAYHPLRRGFDEFFGFLHEGHYYVPPPYHGVTTWLRRRVLPDRGQGRWFHPTGKLILSTHMGHDEPAYDADNPIFSNGQPVVEPTYLTDAFTEKAMDFIDRNRANAFFLYLAYNAVHSPLQGSADYMERFAHIDDIQRRIFAAMLSNLDDSVGAVLRKLRETDLEERTLVFFVSDNGGPTRELTSSNRPLRGGKGQVYEGGIRVPFLCQWKDTLRAGQVFEQSVISLDIFATAARAADAPTPDDRLIDGVDLLPYLKGQKPGNPHDVLFWRMDRRSALRRGDWKLVRTAPRGRSGDYQLFNLAADLGETNDLADVHPEKRLELERQWKALNADMIDPVWKPIRR